MLSELKAWARRIVQDVAALYLAARDSRTPLPAKAVAFTVAAYALSPIDLIPDFIPIIGYLDDLLLVPLGIALAVRLVPVDLMGEFRAQAAAGSSLPSSRVGFGLVIAGWIATAALAGWAVFG